jgi:argininosuccinate lyase
MRAAAGKGFSTATDLADYLVRKQVPFRDAHAIVGQAVSYATRKKKDLVSLTLAELQKFSPKIAKDVYDCLTLEGSVNARNQTGGTAPEQVRKAIKRGRKQLKNHGKVNKES